jgi:ATP-binding cassette subfamily B multidrug efflux pump|tara:strand:- start:1543 stop:3390 length:1848 start_codon:yes stop_codon:yes gene_type:complete
MFRFFEKLVDPYQPYTVSNTPPRLLWPFLQDYLAPFKKIFWFLGCFSALVAAIEIVLIWYLGRLITMLSDTTPTEFWSSHKVELIAVAGFILTLRPIIQAINTLLQNNAMLPNVGTLVRYRAHRHVLGQSVSWFDNDFAGRIANRIMQTPPAMGEVVFQAFDAITFSIAYLIGAIFLLAEADSRLAIPLLIWAGLYGGLVFWTVRRVGPASEAFSDARSAVTGRVVDSYTNIHSVKMFSQDNQELNYGLEAIEKARTTFQYEMRLYTLMDIGLVALNGLLVVSVVGLGIYLWIIGSASVGVVAAGAALTTRMNGMSGWIMWALTTVFRQLGVIREGMETISSPIDLVDLPDAKPLQIEAAHISISNLTHRYGRNFGGLEDVSLEIKPGQSVGLVGASGAGKSTLIKLLLRFYDIEKGIIQFDGQNISHVTQDSLRSQIGVVQQDSSLLHRSVRENILYGRPGSSEEEMIEAAKKAEAHDFILTLEDPEGRVGYDAQVGERGVKLSGGQRQRVALARVILKDAPILVLDEATSALDSAVEADILETLYGVMAGKTVIAIAHRLSTIARMDHIVVLDEGRIVEEGTHDSLLKEDGAYATFWRHQSGGFLATKKTNGV